MAGLSGCVYGYACCCSATSCLPRLLPETCAPDSLNSSFARISLCFRRTPVALNRRPAGQVKVPCAGVLPINWQLHRMSPLPTLSPTTVVCMHDFDDIRPFRDEEVKEVVA